MKILITRRAADARRSAEAVLAAGHESVMLPLFELQPLEAAWPSPEVKYDALIVTSSAVFEAAPDLSARLGSDVPVYCVGETSAQAARQNGFFNIYSAKGNGADLVNLIKSEPIRGRALHVCGQNRSTDFGNELCDHGLNVDVLPVYQIRLIDPGRTKLEQGLEKVKNGAVFLFSPQASADFFSIVKRHKLQYLLTDIAMVAISPQTATKAPEEFSRNIFVAKNPTQNAMLAALRETGLGKPA